MTRSPSIASTAQSSHLAPTHIPCPAILTGANSMAAAGISALGPNCAWLIDHLGLSSDLLPPSVGDRFVVVLSLVDVSPSSTPILVTSHENWRLFFAMPLIICCQSVTYLNTPMSLRSPASSLRTIFSLFCAETAQSSRRRSADRPLLSLASVGSLERIHATSSVLNLWGN